MTADHDSANLVIIKLIRKFNPEFMFNRVFFDQKQDDGTYVWKGTIEFGNLPYIDRYEEVTSEWTPTTIQTYMETFQAAQFAKYQWELQVPGMDIRLYQTVDMSSIFSDLGINGASDIEFRVSDVQYDISETGPITTAILEDIGNDLISEKFRRGSGKNSMSSAIESTIDSKLMGFKKTFNYTKWIPINTFTDTGLLIGNMPMMADETARIKPGYALKMTTYYGETYYGIVKSITASNMVIAGPAIVVPIIDVQYATQENCLELTLFLQGKFAATSSTTLLKTIEKKYYSWSFQTAYLVMVGVNAEIEDTGANQPHINVSIAGTIMLTDNGLEINQATWVYSTDNIDWTNYTINNGDVIEITTDAAGTNDNAENLSVVLKFVLK